MRALEIITGHVIYNPAYIYKFQLKTTMVCKTSKLPSLLAVPTKSKALEVTVSDRNF